MVTKRELTGTRVEFQVSGNDVEGDVALLTAAADWLKAHPSMCLVGIALVPVDRATELHIYVE